MKFLRALSLTILLLSMFNLCVLIYVSLHHPWLWICVIGQMFACYAGAEIVHTMFQKPKMPHPSSMAFEKEVLARFKV